MSTDPTGDVPLASRVTRVLHEATPDMDRPPAELLPLVYEELRKLAADRMRGERPDHTLQPTALVHEAYARLVGDNELQWSNRAHFFAAAAEAMRRILVEHARARQGPRRGGSRQKMPLDVLDVVDLISADDPEQILTLDEAMSRLESEDPEAARVVRLRFYAGLTIDEVASAVGSSPSTVKREWAFARAFLFRALLEKNGQS